MARRQVPALLPDAKPEAKPEAKADAKPDAKPQEKTSTAAKPDAKPNAKPEATPLPWRHLEVWSSGGQDQKQRIDTDQRAVVTFQGVDETIVDCDSQQDGLPAAPRTSAISIPANGGGLPAAPRFIGTDFPQRSSAASIPECGEAAVAGVVRADVSQTGGACSSESPGELRLVKPPPKMMENCQGVCAVPVFLGEDGYDRLEFAREAASEVVELFASPLRPAPLVDYSHARRMTDKLDRLWEFRMCVDLLRDTFDAWEDNESDLQLAEEILDTVEGNLKRIAEISFAHSVDEQQSHLADPPKSGPDSDGKDGDVVLLLLQVVRNETWKRGRLSQALLTSKLYISGLLEMVAEQLIDRHRRPGAIELRRWRHWDELHKTVMLKATKALRWGLVTGQPQTRSDHASGEEWSVEPICCTMDGECLAADPEAVVRECLVARTIQCRKQLFAVGCMSGPSGSGNVEPHQESNRQRGSTRHHIN